MDEARHPSWADAPRAMRRAKAIGDAIDTAGDLLDLANADPSDFDQHSKPGYGQLRSRLLDGLAQDHLGGEKIINQAVRTEDQP